MTMLSEKKLKEIYEFSSGIVCRSDPLLKRLIKWLPELKDRCFVAYSGIKKEIIDRAKKERNRILKESDEEIYDLRQKSQSRMPKAVAKIREKVERSLKKGAL